MDIWQKQYRRILVLTALSAAVFSMCLIVGVVGVLTQNEPIAFWLPVPAIIAILMVPRDTVPRGQTPSQELERELYTRLSRMKLWLSYVRVSYLFATIFVLFGLPKLVFP
ncbi:MAG: hypothetical protein R3E66_11075 [bacterium]